MGELNYRYLPAGEDGRDRHIWSLAGPLGGVHIWAKRTDDKTYRRYGERYFGGVECHSPKPLYDFAREPSDAHCWLIDGPCWHDGSALQFSEQVEPIITMSDDPFPDATHEIINSILHSRYVSWFEDRAAAE